MMADRKVTIKAIFAAGLNVDPDQRSKYLDEACDGDAQLLNEVRSLLLAHDMSEGFMEKPAVGEVADILIDIRQLSKGTCFGHYEILEQIGIGGMGEVYLARDRNLNRKVAVKFLPFHTRRQKNNLKRFEQEAQIVSALNHPNILTIYDFEIYDNENLLVSEFVEGFTLRERMKRGPIPVGESIEIAVQTASALSSAHGAGIIHRDIKPQNIMVRPDGLVKVLDFGIAKLTDLRSDLPAGFDKNVGKTQTNPGVILGTVNYMSPEQARGKSVDFRTDIFSLGVVLYEMLTGLPPFDHETAADTFSLILNKEPKPITDYLPDIPGELQEAVDRMLAKDPAKRYQAADGIVFDLKGLQGLVATSQVSVTKRNNAALGTGDLTDKKNEETEEYVTAGQGSQKSRMAVGLFILLASAFWTIYWFSTTNSAENFEIRSIAVMPFVNDSVNSDSEYLSDGMTEYLIGSLSQITDLKVKARSSVFRYKGRETNARAIGREFDAQTILTGRMTRRGEDLTLYLELIDAETENVLWSGYYLRRVFEVANLQADIARDVSIRLRSRKSDEEVEKIAKVPSTDDEAYRHYLRGRFLWNKRTGKDLTLAISEFEQAVGRDPQFALAYVGLADSYALLEQYNGTPAGETLPKAKAYAEKALSINNSLAEAHVSLGFIYYTMWDWVASDREFKQAIELKPNYSSAHHWYYVLLRDTGRLDEALKQIKIASELDPLSLVINVSHSRAFVLTGDLDRGLELTKKLIEMYPNYAPNYVSLGLVYLSRGFKNEAMAEMGKAVSIERTGFTLSLFGYMKGISGEFAEANEIILELQAKYARREILGRDVAAVYVGLGMHDKAFAWLEKDFLSRSSELPAITSVQLFDPLRNDPRYKDLMMRMGLNHGSSLHNSKKL